ncbi:MAG: phosphotransferase, partial [Mycobacteriaceae bacterium]
MHEHEVPISHEQVAAHVAGELPELAGLEIVAIDGGGTVNAIYRIGSFVTARFPLRYQNPDRMLVRLRKEKSAAAEFVLACPIPAPKPLHIGSPGHGYPLPWATQSWLPGATATPTSCDRAVLLASDLTDVLSHLRGWPTGGRLF